MEAARSINTLWAQTTSYTLCLKRSLAQSMSPPPPPPFGAAFSSPLRTATAPRLVFCASFRPAQLSVCLSLVSLPAQTGTPPRRRNNKRIETPLMPSAISSLASQLLRREGEGIWLLLVMHVCHGCHGIVRSGCTSLRHALPWNLSRCIEHILEGVRHPAPKGNPLGPGC